MSVVCECVDVDAEREVIDKEELRAVPLEEEEANGGCDEATSSRGERAMET